MAKTKKVQATQDNPVSKYVRQTRAELRKVTWPSREESQRLTLIVLAVTILFALFLGALDFGFSRVIGLFVDLFADI